MGDKSRIVKRGKGDLPKVYRPLKISEVYGQDEIKEVISRGLDERSLAHSILLHGVSGTGKTTMGRIIAMGLNCIEGPTSEPCCVCKYCRQVICGNSFAFKEINAAHVTGIDYMRQLAGESSCANIDGSRNKIYLFDECHRLSLPAQQLLLKEVEDVRSELYFIFCSTDRASIITPLINRCMQFEFKEVPSETIMELLCDVCKAENLNANADVLNRIVQEAHGMPRNALYLLQKEVSLRNIESRAYALMEEVRRQFKGFQAIGR